MYKFSHSSCRFVNHIITTLASDGLVTGRFTHLCRRTALPRAVWRYRGSQSLMCINHSKTFQRDVLSFSLPMLNCSRLLSMFLDCLLFLPLAQGKVFQGFYLPVSRSSVWSSLVIDKVLSLGANKLSDPFRDSQNTHMHTGL